MLLVQCPQRTHPCVLPPPSPHPASPQLCEQQLQQVSSVLIPHHVQLVHDHTAQLLKALLLKHAADQCIGLLNGGDDDACMHCSA